MNTEIALGMITLQSRNTDFLEITSIEPRGLLLKNSISTLQR